MKSMKCTRPGFGLDGDGPGRNPSKKKRKPNKRGVYRVFKSGRVLSPPSSGRHGGRIAAAGVARRRALPCAPAGAGLVGQRVGRRARIWAGAPSDFGGAAHASARAELSPSSPAARCAARASAPPSAPPAQHTRDTRWHVLADACVRAAGTAHARPALAVDGSSRRHALAGACMRAAGAAHARPALVVGGAFHGAHFLTPCVPLHGRRWCVVRAS